MITVLDSFWSGRTKLASAGLAAALAACGTPAPPVATAPDVTAADSEIAEPGDTAVTEIADVGETADADMLESIDASGLDSDTGPSDATLDVAVLQLDCTAPQTEGCPCTVVNVQCCITPHYGLLCSDWYGPPVWSPVSDCCLGSEPGCNYPNPPRQWCNGKVP